MIYKFIDNNEEEKGLVCNALESMCVPHRVERRTHERFMGYEHEYDVVIDVRPEKLDKIQEVVDNYLSIKRRYDEPNELSMFDRRPCNTSKRCFDAAAGMASPKSMLDIFERAFGSVESLRQEIRKDRQDAERKEPKTVKQYWNELQNKIKRTWNKLFKKEETILEAIERLNKKEKRFIESLKDLNDRPPVPSLGELLATLSNKGMFPDEIRVMDEMDFFMSTKQINDAIDEITRLDSNRVYTFGSLSKVVQMFLKNSMRGKHTIKDTTRFKFDTTSNGLGITVIDKEP